MARERGSDRERLLRLIDAGSGAPRAAVSTEPAGPKGPQRPPRAIGASIAAVFRRGRSEPGPGTALSWVNRFLVVALAAVMGYGALDLFGAVSRANKAPSPLTAQEMGASDLLSAATPASSAGISAVFDQDRIEGGAAGVPSSASTLGWRLVGVDWGGPEPVALLEDKAGGKTYSRRKGDVLGDWRIDEIQRRKVIASGPGGQVEIQ